jgi:NAD+ diphosphatase
VFPRIEPAVIVAVTRAPNEILLAHAGRLPPGMHSVLAGFVEPGESLEQCVAREVFEETGIEVGNIRYVASQPWPFPRGLMVGFVADYVSGSIVIDPHELQGAAWFDWNNLPSLPSHLSIARFLIEHAKAQLVRG